MDKLSSICVYSLKFVCIFVLSLILGPESYAQLGPVFTGLSAAAENASTAYSNPAGLTRLDNTEFVLQFTGLYSVSDFVLKEGTTAEGDGPEKNENFIYIPSLYFNKPVGEKLRLGFTFNVPGGIGSDYGDDDWAGRFSLQETTLFYLAFTPVVAYRVTDWLSLGGGISITYVNYDTKAAINNRFENISDGKIELEVDGWGVGFTLATLIEVSPRFRFGVVYRSESEPELKGKPEFKNIGPIRENILRNLGLLGAEVNAEMKTPQSLQAGLYYELNDNISFTLDGMWFNFEEFGAEQVSVGDNSIAVDTEFEDVWAFSVGTKYRLSEKWAVAAGFFYASELSTDENRTLGFPIADIWGTGIGFVRELTGKRRLHFNFNYLGFGDAPIDTEQSDLSGRIVGKFEDNYILGFDIAIVWGL